MLTPTRGPTAMVQGIGTGVLRAGGSVLVVVVYTGRRKLRAEVSSSDKYNLFEVRRTYVT